MEILGVLLGSFLPFFLPLVVNTSQYYLYRLEHVSWCVLSLLLVLYVINI
jgi:hypothetical protein